MHPSTRRRGRRTEVDTLDPGPIGVPLRGGPEESLPQRGRAGADVTPDLARVVDLGVRGGRGEVGQDAIAEPGGEPLDL